MCFWRPPSLTLMLGVALTLTVSLPEKVGSARAWKSPLPRVTMKSAQAQTALLPVTGGVAVLAVGSPLPLMKALPPKAAQLREETRVRLLTKRE